MSQANWFRHDFGETDKCSLINNGHGNVSKALTEKETIQVVPPSLGHRNKCQQPSPSYLFIETYKPDQVSDLVVPKKKIEEVRNWLLEAFTKSNAKQAPFLILNGPSGCGKYETLRLLCKELNVDVHQWNEQIRNESAYEKEYRYGCFPQGPNSEERIAPDLNPIDHLKEFMMRTNRYNSLTIKGTSATNSLNKKLLLLKDLPPLTDRNQELWHSLLMEYSQKGTTPLVCIVTEGNSSQGMNGLKLFPAVLRERLCMSGISFNGLANSFVMKALERVLTRESKCMPANFQLEDIVNSCNGDLRNGLNTLQLVLEGCAPSKKQIPTKTRKRPKASRDSNESTSATISSKRDGSLDFMHTLGKVLYSKRLESPKISADLPLHLIEEERSPLKENVDQLVEQMVITPSKILLYLHQNSPPFFNSIEDFTKAAHYLSSSALFSDQSFQNETIDTCAFLTAVRGIMHSNTEVIGSSWRPLVKPEYHAVQKIQTEAKTDARNLWPHLTEDQIFSERLPCMRRLLKNRYSSFSPEENQFIQRFEKYNLKELSSHSSAGVDSRQKWKRQQEVILPTINPPPMEEDQDVVIEDIDD